MAEMPQQRSGELEQQLRSRSNLTSGQFLIWLGQQIAPEKPVYNMIQTFAIQGALDHRAFSEAFAHLVRDSDTLRTVIRTIDGVPVQLVQPAVDFDLPLIDFTVAEEPKLAYESWLAERKIRSLELDTRLFDTVLIRLGRERYVWYLCMHHLITDGYAFSLTFRLMSERYELALLNRLDEATVLQPFAAQLEHERSIRRSPRWASAATHWRRQIENPYPAPEFYGRRPSGKEDRTKRLVLELGALRSARLHTVARSEPFAALSHGMALNCLWMTLLSVAIHRITGERDIRLGTPFESRPSPREKATLGLLMQIGVANVSVMPEDTFASLHERVMAEVFNGLRYSLPGVGSVDLHRSYSLMLNYVTATFEEFAGMPVTVDWIHTGWGESGHACQVQVCDFGSTGEFVLHVDVNEQVFPGVEQQWLLDQLLAVIEAFLENPQRGVGSFDLLTEHEKRRFLVDFNATEQPTAQHSVVDLLELRAVQKPESTAVMQGELRLSYRNLNDSANRVAAELHEIGVMPGERVVISMTRSVWAVAAIWGVLKTGAAFTPLDPCYPNKRKMELIEDLEPAAVIVDEEADTSGWLNARLPVLLPERLDMTLPCPGNPQRVTGPDDAAYLIYTSGSTGMPKAAILTHGGLSNYVTWADAAYLTRRPADFALYSSLSFDLTLTSIFVPVVSGGAIRVYSERDHVAGLEVLSVFEEDAVDVVKLTPAHLAMLRESEPVSRIRTLIVGGEELLTQVTRSIADGLGVGDVFNEYGPTEATIGCMVHRYDRNRDVGRAVPIGRPIANTRIHLRDGYGQPVPSGVVGEIVIEGPGVARGYWRRNSLSAERFTQRITDGCVEYRTGDLGRWDEEGALCFLGRADDQVKVRGIRVELAEIESTLVQHPAVAQAVVLAREVPTNIDASSGESAGRRLVAYVTGADFVDATEVGAFLAARLPGYMVPSQLVQLDQLPLTRNGKIDREALPDPDPLPVVLSSSYVAPRTDVERTLAGIWQQVMGGDLPGVQHNYFELGGDSVMSIQIAALAQSKGIALTPRMVFTIPTIAGLSAEVGRVIEPGSLPPGDSGGKQDVEHLRRQLGDEQFAELESVYPLTPTQSGMLYHWTSSPGALHYLGQVSCELRGAIDLDALRQSWSQTIAAHGVLRTRFFWRGIDEPLQAVCRVVEPPWMVLDWRDRDPDELPGLIERLELDLSRKGYHLDDQCLMRFTLVRLSEQRLRFIWNVHHILLDGWSTYPLFSEALQRYEAVLEGREDAFPAGLPFADYVSWLGVQDHARDTAFWRAYLDGYHEPSLLPATLESPQGSPALGASDCVSVAFGTAEEAALRALARRSRTTLNCVFQAAWGVVVGRYADTEDVVFGVTVSGRNGDLPGVESAIGMFLNTLPLRLEPRAELSVAGYLSEVHASMDRLSAHESSSLAEVRRNCAVAADTELFDSILVFENYPRSLAYPDKHIEVGELHFSAPSHYPLAVLVYPEERCRCDFVFDCEHFSREQIEGVVRQFTTVASAMADAGDILLSQLPMMTASEALQVARWSRSTPVEEADLPIDLIVRRTAEHDSRPAIISGTESLSYGDLQRRADALAAQLRGMGIGRGSIVAIEAAWQEQTIVSMLGTWKAGAAFVPIEADYPVSRLEAILSETNPSVLLAAENSRLKRVGDVDVLDVTCVDASSGDGTSLSDAEPDGLAYVLYTSGSTGTPKGVRISHRGIGLSTQARFSVYEDRVERFLLLSSFAFDSSMAGLWWTLCQGGTLVLADPERFQNPAYLTELIRCQKVTHTLALPGVYRALLDAAGETQLSSLKVAVVAGEVCHSEIFDMHRQRCPDAALFNEYGPTEVAVWSHYYRFPESFSSAVVPIGVPIPHILQRVVDRSMRPVPPGMPGELLLGGASISAGYFEQPELTRERFVSLPGLPSGQERFYRTGDLVRWRSDGDLEFLGRIDEQIKVRGYRLEPAEVMAVIEDHPQVRALHVGGWKGSDGRPRLVAWYVASEAAPSDLDLAGWAKARLPDFMVPEHFVSLTVMPVLPNGKVDVAALSLRHPPQARARSLHRHAATPGERQLAAICCELLGLDEIGMDEDFVSLGGDSLMAMRLAAMAFREGLSISPRLIMDGQTFAELAGALEVVEAQQSEESPERFSMSGLDAGELDELIGELVPPQPTES